jgi:hypothetical protein
MRASLVAAPLVVAAGLCLTACGGSDDVATDPPASSSSPDNSPPADPAPSTTDPAQTCADLYHPPGQLLLRAIEFVHGRSAGDPVAEAAEIVAGLSAVADTAEPRFDADLAIVRTAVDQEQDLTSFDAATDRLAQACATYGE